jgi:hypothetical protein
MEKNVKFCYSLIKAFVVNLPWPKKYIDAASDLRDVCSIREATVLLLTGGKIIQRMTSSATQPERREFPRVRLPISLSLAVSGTKQPESFNAAALNVSMNGVYCHVNRYLPLFEKVLITFVLPEGTHQTFHLVSQCEGVVVRIDPEEEQSAPTDYYVALYFNNLSDTERDLLQTLLATYQN